MKKFIIAMLIMLTGVAAASARDSYSRDIKVLPAAAQNFIARNFKAKVNLIKIDSGTFSSTDYDVILTADHGGHDRIHGTELPEDMTIPVLMQGPDFAPGV